MQYSLCARSFFFLSHKYTHTQNTYIYTQHMDNINCYVFGGSKLLISRSCRQLLGKMYGRFQRLSSHRLPGKNANDDETRNIEEAWNLEKCMHGPDVARHIFKVIGSNNVKNERRVTAVKFRNRPGDVRKSEFYIHVQYIYIYI